MFKKVFHQKTHKFGFKRTSFGGAEPPALRRCPTRRTAERSSSPSSFVCID